MKALETAGPGFAAHYAAWQAWAASPAGTPPPRMESNTVLAKVAPGMVRLQLAFTVGLGRNWLNLRKQTIDALGTILGNAPGAGPWAPLDGRIVDLGPHCRTDPAPGLYAWPLKLRV